MLNADAEHYDTEAAADEDTDRTLAALGVTREQVIQEINYRQAKKYEKAVKRMAAAQRAGGERRVFKDGAGSEGQVEMMIDPISYHYWGQRLGYECWDDKAFRREYLRDNPSSRIKTVSRIMWTPSLSLQARLKQERAGRVAGQMIAQQQPLTRGLVTA